MQCILLFWFFSSYYFLEVVFFFLIIHTQTHSIVERQCWDGLFDLLLTFGPISIYLLFGVNSMNNAMLYLDEWISWSSVSRESQVTGFHHHDRQSFCRWKIRQGEHHLPQFGSTLQTNQSIIYANIRDRINNNGSKFYCF